MSPPADGARWATLTPTAAAVHQAWPALAGHWYIAATGRELRRRPLARTVLGLPLALFRSAGGRPAALLDRCPHRNVALAGGRLARGCLACPYHGWQFDAAGACRTLPGLPEGAPSAQAARATPAFATLEQQGFVWVYLGDDAPSSGPPAIAHLSERGYTSFSGAAGLLTAALPDALENFLDGLHTHFVHAGLIRREGHRREVTVTVRRTAGGAAAEYPEAPSGFIARLFGGGLDRAVGAFRLPCVAALDYWAGPRLKLGLTLHFTPVDAAHVRLFAVGVAPAPALGGRLGEPLLVALMRLALRQDAAILAAQAANLARFGGPRYAYTPLDVLRPHIQRLLRHGPSAEGLPAEQRVAMRL
ncbi:MAG: aromatic ring-hydroxylating dioxygenase subunit alpha [Anaerolineales bacterium]|nr:aromatic ring-hydroxylating dioxygenase subunit alpha [Anaerolineales bacterium]